MANLNCDSCEEIRQLDPSFIVNGFGDDECNSLQNDTGLVTTSGHDDAYDLNLMNDCLVGTLETTVQSYDVCDWKAFMKRLIPNLWATLKGIICAIKGIWTMIHKLECLVNYLYDGDEFELGEYTKADSSHLVAGKGVSFLNVGDSGISSDVKVTFVAGGLAHLAGSCIFYTSGFQDAATVYNFDDDGDGSRHTMSRSGNSEWDQHDHKPLGGSQLVYEIRIKKSEYPRIERFFTGIALNAQGGGYHAEICRFGAGAYAFGQNGHCDRTNGDPVNSDSSRGHLVPEGWEYLQMRIVWVENMNADSEGKQFTPVGMLGMRMKQDSITC